MVGTLKVFVGLVPGGLAPGTGPGRGPNGLKIGFADAVRGGFVVEANAGGPNGVEEAVKGTAGPPGMNGAADGLSDD